MHAGGLHSTEMNLVKVIIFTQRRSVAKTVECFQRRLFVCLLACLIANAITSERVNIG